MQEWAKSFYKSRAWLKCRKTYISERVLIDGGLCEECGKKLGYIVHHKVMLTPENITDANITLNAENFEYVCKDCHDKFEGHGVYKGLKPLCAFDAEGNPISLREIDSPHKKEGGGVW